MPCGGRDPSGVSVPRSPVVRSVPTSAAKVHVVEPLNFNDTQEIGDRVKGDRTEVILNLQGSGRELQRRIIDFSSGLAYAVGGSMRGRRLGVLLTPMNVPLRRGEGTARGPRLQRPQVAERFRGAPRLNNHPETNETLCIGCDLCALACPEQLIMVGTERNEKTRRKELTFAFDLFALDSVAKFSH